MEKGKEISEKKKLLEEPNPPLSPKARALLEAAARKDPDKIESILLDSSVSPNVLDENGNTPLHLALTLGCCCDCCTESCESCVAVLLNSPQIQVDIQNKLGRTPLHLAAMYQLEDCVQNLVLRGADPYARSKNGEGVLKLIANKAPNCVCKMLDNAVAISDSHPRSEDCSVTVDFRPIVAKASEFTEFPKEMEFLQFLLASSKEVREKILLHPVIGIFLYQKWRRAKWQLFGTLALRVLWIIAFSSYVMYVYLSKCPCMNISPSEGAGNVKNSSAAAQKRREMCLEATKIDATFCILVAVTLLEMVYIATQIVNRGHWSKLNLFHLLVLALAMGTFYPTFASQGNIEGPQYELAALTIFCAWALCLSLFGKFPSIGIYLEMFGHVLHRFWTILPTFIMLFVAFALAFCVLFPSTSIKYYSLFHMAFLKVLIMMSGELEYEDLFYGDKATDYYVPFTGHVLYAVFVVVVVIVLMNLLVGLTVSDIQAIEKEAELSRISRQISEMYHLESMLFSPCVPQRLQKLFYKLTSVAPNKKQLTFTFRINDPKDKSVSDTVKASVRPLVTQIYNSQQDCPRKPRYSLKIPAIAGTRDSDSDVQPGVRVYKTTTVVNEQFVYP